MKSKIDFSTSDLLPAIGVFLVAAEKLNFSHAGRALGLTPAGVSRAVGRLEERLGVALFLRTTRVVTLTDEGQFYYAHCAEAIKSMREAGRFLAGRRMEPQGLLRLSVPTTYGYSRLLPVLPKFLELYPKIAVDVDISNRNADLIEEGFDAAIRLGELPDSRLMVRKLEDASLGLFATPGYLAQHGVPQSIRDLQNHRCIPFEVPSTGKAMPWLLRDSNQECDWLPTGGVRFEGDALACLHYARAGGGICQMYHFVARDSVAQGELVALMPEHTGRTRRFSMIYPKSRHISMKLHALRDFLVQQPQAA